MMWRAMKGPELDMEGVFAPPRRWRFDFAFEKNATIEDIHDDGLLPVRIATELEGGIWTGGGICEVQDSRLNLKNTGLQ